MRCREREPDRSAPRAAAVEQAVRPGVLALQGSAEPHSARLRELGYEPVEVRQRPHLDAVTHLILPGGESTTLHHLLTLYGLWDPIVERYRANDLALFGTCAGAILLGWAEDSERPPRMRLADAAVARNAYGRQVDSFTRDLVLEGFDGPPFHAIFIRAPRIGAVGPKLQVLARDGADPVLVEGGRILLATFHPELTEDTRIHERFLRM
jgi:5'-phosphate synthase pdxT subunit